MRLLLVDNFDSFVYNLAQAFGALGTDPVVLRSDLPLDDLIATEPDAVVISPGPGTPLESGVSIEAVRHFSAKGIPLLGVCLGHQCITEAFGGRVERAVVGPVHGKTSMITHNEQGVFRGLPSPFVATRYHSLAVEEALPDVLEVTARSSDGVVMGLRHKELPVEGVQFHPESVLTDEGPKLLENFLTAAISNSV